MKIGSEIYDPAGDDFGRVVEVSERGVRVRWSGVYRNCGSAIESVYTPAQMAGLGWRVVDAPRTSPISPYELRADTSLRAIARSAAMKK